MKPFLSKNMPKGTLLRRTYPKKKAPLPKGIGRGAFRCVYLMAGRA